MCERYTTQIVDFSMILEMDGKNINCYIVYDDDNVWPLELSSGMERFISSLAMRVGLINVSNLPMPNILILMRVGELWIQII